MSHRTVLALEMGGFHRASASSMIKSWPPDTKAVSEGTWRQRA